MANPDIVQELQNDEDDEEKHEGENEAEQDAVPTGNTQQQADNNKEDSE